MKNNKLMHNARIMMFAIIALFCMSTASLAATFYVDSINGNDNNAGAQTAPWLTVTKVNNATLNPGDTVYFKRGGSWATVLVPKSGVSGKPITYDAYGTGNLPVMAGFNASNKSYATAKNIEFRSSGTAITLATSNHIIIDSCNASSTTTGWNPVVYILTNSQYNQILNCNLSFTASNIMNDVINLRNYANYNLIEGNTITIQGGHTAIGLEGATGSSGSGTAHYNFIRNNKIISLGGSHFSTMSNSNYNIIEGNSLTGCGGVSPGGTNPARTQGGLTIDTANNIVRKNILSDSTCNDSRGIMMESNAGSGYANNVQYNHVYNNVITGIITGGQGIYLGTNGNAGVSTDHNYFKNNAVFNNGGTYLQTNLDGSLTSSSKNTQILVLNSSAISNNFFSHNLFYKSNDTNIMWVNGSYLTVSATQAWNGTMYYGNIQAAPLFDASFNPQAGSPVIDAGDFLTTITSASGSGTVFTVADAGYFTDGFGVTRGDTIIVKNTTTTIVSVNYTTNQITVANTISWNNGDPVNLPYNGSKPDIGAFEYGSAVTLPAPRNLM